MSLFGISTADLQKLRDLAAGRSVSCPLTDASLRANGFGSIAAPLLATLAFGDRDALVLALDLVIEERLRAERPPIELVWTGPGTSAPQTRDTAIVLTDLFSRATRRVMVAGYWFTQSSILQPLHAALLRGVEARMFIHLDAGVSSLDAVPAYATACIRKFVADRWIFGPPYPEFFVDPRTALHAPKRTLLHAKCAVADGRYALVTSANFTEAAQHQNIEVGVLLDDVRFAGRLEGHFNALVGQGTLASVQWKK